MSARALAIVALVLLSRAAHAGADEAVTPAHSASVQRLDGIAAVVGGLAPGPGVLTLYRSDIELHARLALLAEGGMEAALGALPSALLRASLTQLVGEALIAVESTRLSLTRPTPGALAEERTRLLAGRTSPALVRELLLALGVSERELAAVIERRAIVSGFLQANLEGTLDLSPDELERRFERDAHPFRGQSYAEAGARFAAWLTQQRLEQAVARWVESLIQRTPHRLLATY